MHHVFISYSRRDLNDVRPVLRQLNHLRVPYWVDTSDIPISVAWDQEISRAITASTLVVYFDSAHWRQSPNCQSEFERARMANRPLLPIPIGVGCDAVAAAERIRTVYASGLPAQRPLTELAVRASEWEVRGRARGRLASPKQVKEFRRLAPASLPPVSAEYIRASRRRNTGRTILVVVGALITSTLLATLYALPKAADRANTELNQITKDFADQAEGYDTLKYNVYGALTRAADRIVPGDTSYIHLNDLTSALNVEVPDRVENTGAETPPTSVPQATSANGSLTATARPDSAVIDILAGGTLAHQVTLSQEPSGLAISPDGRTIAATTGRNVDIVSVSQNAVIQTLRGSPVALWSPSWSADGTSISASTAELGTLSWTWRDGDVLLADESWITNGATLPHDGFAALTRSGELIMNDHGIITRHQTAVKLTVWLSASRDGTRLAVSDISSVVVHTRSTGSDQRIDVPDCHVAGTGFDPTGTQLYVACTQDGLVRINLLTGTVAARISTGNDVLPYSVAVADTGEVFTGGFHGTLAEFTADLSTYQTMTGSSSCPSPRYSIAVSPNAEVLVAVGDGGSLLGCTLMAVRSEDVWTVHIIPPGETRARQARAVAINPSGTIAAIGYGDGTVANLLIPDGNPGLSWHQATSAVRGLGFREDGSLTVASRDGMIQTMPGCPSCDDPMVLAQIAQNRVAYAKEWRLTD